jgi:hypothetical protein
MLTPVLDATGLTLLRTEDVLANLVESVQSSPQFGPEEAVGGDTPLGQILAPVAQQIGLTYEAVQSAYDCTDPEAAEGVVLDSIAAARGMTREPATYSTVGLICTGTTSTVIAAGKRVRVADGAVFAIDHAVTIAPGTTVVADATCTVTGPQEAAIGACTTIVDAVAGWSAVTNPAAAVLGSDEETDAALRARMATSGSIDGRCTLPAIRANVLALDSVDACVVLTNRALVTDSDGLPGKSFRVVVWPAQSSDEEEAIAGVIWDHLPAGIYCDGTTAVVVTDEQGDSETIRFSLATEQVLHWVAIVTTTPVDPAAEPFPVDGLDLIEAAILAYGNTLGVAQDVIPLAAAGYCTAGYVDATTGVRVPGIPGIRALEVRVKVGGAPGGGDTVPIVIGSTQVATTIAANVSAT